MLSALRVKPKSEYCWYRNSCYFFSFAHRFFCAAEIFARAAADIFHVRFVFTTALPSPRAFRAASS